MEVVLVCETEPDDPSHEIRLIYAVLNGIHGCDVTVVGSGGGEGLGAVASYLVASNQAAAAAVVQDRDYRPLSWADKSFESGSRRFMWHRHELENYVLEPNVVARGLSDLQASLRSTPHPPKWMDSVPTQAAQVRAELIEVARTRLAIEATQHCLWETQRELQAIGRVQLSVKVATTSTPDECRDALVAECAAKRGLCLDLGRAECLAPATVGATFDRHLANISATGYLDGLEFLRDFGGRELLDAFTERLRQRYGMHGLKTTRVMQLLADAMPSVYAGTRQLYDPDDFADLAMRLRELSGRS
ncbi:MAG: hypothetical protein KKI08_12925 [Armatimonadetes bacterium]|nr:hypothetical protein [Armatimonadota bacterium]